MCCCAVVAQGNRSAHRTLRAWELDVLSKASYWEQCRRQRMTDFEDLQVRVVQRGGGGFSRGECTSR